MTDRVWTLEQQIAWSRRHAHGMDCCWDCFAGKRTHPVGDDDPNCEDRGDKDGRCLYAPKESA